eukprot:351311-Chlamydomonas_euryale.AAC.7
MLLPPLLLLLLPLLALPKASPRTGGDCRKRRLHDEGSVAALERGVLTARRKRRSPSRNNPLLRGFYIRDAGPAAGAAVVCFRAATAGGLQ